MQCTVASGALGRPGLPEPPRCHSPPTIQLSPVFAHMHSTFTEFIELLRVRRCASAWDTENKRQSLFQRNSEIIGERDKEINNCCISEPTLGLFTCVVLAIFLVTTSY